MIGIMIVLVVKEISYMEGWKCHFIYNNTPCILRACLCMMEVLFQMYYHS